MTEMSNEINPPISPDTRHENMDVEAIIHKMIMREPSRVENEEEKNVLKERVVQMLYSGSTIPRVKNMAQAAGGDTGLNLFLEVCQEYGIPRSRTEAFWMFLQEIWHEF